MKYQNLILGAGNKTHVRAEFDKCKYIVKDGKNLLQLALTSFDNESLKIIALDSEDFAYFSDFQLPTNVSLHCISRPTKGALATAGMCLDKVVNDTPVLVSAVDGLCFKIANAFVDKMFEADSDGGLIVFKSYNKNYSYVREANGSPIELVEKQNVSAIASTGIYYFRNKEFLVDSISWALLNKIEVDEKYYVSSAINKLIFENKKVSLFEIDESEYFRFSTKAEADDSIRRLNL